MTTSSNDSIHLAFKASNGKYVTVDSSSNELLATSTAIESSENFQLIHQDNHTVALLGSNGKYVSNQQNGTGLLAAVAATVSETEQFEIQPCDDMGVAIFASNEKFVQLVTSNSGLQALGEEIDSADSFTVVPLNDSGQPIPEPSLSTRDASAKAVPQAATPSTTPSDVFTVCFSGTACTRDEGEVSRSESNKDIYYPSAGYIPVRIHKEISGSLTATSPSVTIRGVGENDWAVPRDNSDPLVFDGPLNADSTLLSYVMSYSGGNQYSIATQLDGWSAPALALHAANLAAASGASTYNFIGHSRGAVEAIMAAWFIYAYGSDEVKNIPINIFAIDPVPGTGEWYGILTQLPPNVVNYVGVYAWDMCVQPGDKPFMGLVPRPNGRMTGKDNTVELKNYWWWPLNKWKYLADDAQLTDPLESGTDPQPTGYELYACRGRHSTVAGNYTSDSEYDPAKISNTVAPVPELVYKMARGYLTKWGTTFQTASAVSDEVLDLRQSINTYHSDFDAMGGGETRTSALPFRPYVRRISSIYGVNPENSYPYNAT